MCNSLCSTVGSIAQLFTCISHAEKRREPRDPRHHHGPKRLEHDYDVSAQVLGTGLNGDVTMASSRTQPGQKFAVKTLQLSTATPRELELMKQELASHLCLDHPHIVRLFDVYESSDCIHLVMEYMDGGEVFDRIHDKGALTEDETRRAVRQILLALAHMHKQGIVHRDVKLENCVYQNKDSDDLKLIDFGLSARWDSMNHADMHDPVGTMEYVAPELIQKSYTNKCDLWSLGVTTFAMITGTMPFFGTASVMARQIERGSYLVPPEQGNTFSTDFHDFLQSLININPRTRLSAQQALAHPWISRVPTLLPESFAVVARSLREFSRTPKFHHRCMEILAMSLPSEEESEMSEYFLALDKKCQGAIDLEDIRHLMVDEFPAADEKEISEMLASLPCHGGDLMHYTAFVAAMMCTQLGISDGLVKSAFRRFDVDGSNTITANDCSMVCGDHSLMLNESIQDFIAAADKTGDGHISLDEFDVYLRAPPVKESGLDVQDGRTIQIIAEEQSKIQKRFEKSTGMLYLTFPMRVVAVIALSLLLAFRLSSGHRFSSPPRLLCDSSSFDWFEASEFHEQELGHATSMATAALCVSEDDQVPFDAIGIDSDWHCGDGRFTSRHSRRRRRCVENACLVQLTASCLAPVSTTFTS